VQKKAARDREEAEKRKNKGGGTAKKKSGSGEASSGRASSGRASSGRGPRNPYMFDKLEKKIMKLEKELETLHASVATEEVYGDSNKLRETQFRIAEVENDLESANDEWMNWETA